VTNDCSFAEALSPLVAAIKPFFPIMATLIAMILVILIFIIPIASVLTSTFSNSLVIFLETFLLSFGGFVTSLLSHPIAIPAGIGIELGGLLVAIGGVQSRRRSVAMWHAIDRLPASPSIVPSSHAASSNQPAVDPVLATSLEDIEGSKIEEHQEKR